MGTKRQTIKQHHRLAVLLLCIGIGLVAVSFLLNLAFLKPENFKSRYREKQYNDCMSVHAEAECAKRFKD